MDVEGTVVVDSWVEGMFVVVVEGAVRGMTELGLMGVAELTVLAERIGLAELTVVVEGFAVVEGAVRPNNLNIRVIFKTLSSNNSHFVSIDFCRVRGKNV
jgi:hypothetical protein